MQFAVGADGRKVCVDKDLRYYVLLMTIDYENTMFTLKHK